MLLSLPILANDEVDNETQPEDDGAFRWELMLGISAVYDPEILKGVDNTEFEDYLEIPLWIDMSYKGFFIRSNKRRATTYSGEVGYELVANNDWGLDLISKTYLPEINPDEIFADQGKVIPILQGLKNREFAGGFALRYNQYQDNSIFTLEFAYLKSLEISNNWLIEGFYSYLIPYRNWDIYLGTGLTYYSSDVVNYYVGVSADEVTQFRSKYSPSSGFRAQFEFFAQHPISENWSFNVGITQNYYSKSIAHSPIIYHANITQLLVGLRYVY